MTFVPEIPAASTVDDGLTCTAQSTLPPARRGSLRLELPMRHAGLRSIDLQWEWCGPPDTPVVLVAGGISAGRHVLANAVDPQPGWWQAQAGIGLDPARQAMLAIDWIGADGLLDAPIDTTDQADAVAHLLDALGIKAVHWVGASYGAMCGLAFAARHPLRLNTLCMVSAAHRAHPLASAWRSLQRRALTLSGTTELARQIAMLGYRTPAELAARFEVPPKIVNGEVRVGADDWLDACARRFSGRYSPTAYRRLSESLDLHRVDPAGVQVPVTLVAVSEDQLVPLTQMLALNHALPRSTLHVLQSQYGHDAFLKETATIGQLLRGHLETLV